MKFVFTAQNFHIWWLFYILNVSIHQSPCNYRYTVLVYSPLCKNLLVDKEKIVDNPTFIKTTGDFFVYLWEIKKKKKQVFFAAISVHRRHVSKNTRSYTLHQLNSCFHNIVMNYWAKKRPCTLPSLVLLFMEVMVVGGWWAESMDWGPEMMQFCQPHTCSVSGRLKARLPGCSHRAQPCEKQCIMCWWSAHTLELDLLGLILTPAQPLLFI